MKNKEFFKGWYFKHQNNNETIAFIPGINIKSEDEKYSFIQVITEGDSYYFEYDYRDFFMNEKNLFIEIGENKFSDKGIEINIENEDITIKGSIQYENTTPLESDIMGPFSMFPFMECNHGVISLHHNLSGSVSFNNKVYDFQNGIGYIEMDWGTSFPKDYLWIHCNDFKPDKLSIMVSIAEIPFMGARFKGCISVVYYNNKEYRLATYKGVKIVKYNEGYVELFQGKYRLIIEMEGFNGHKLMAPVKGDMNKIIKENPCCKGRFKFYINENMEFDLVSDNVSFEYVE